MEEVFGANVGVPATNATRWNSLLHQVKGILRKGMTELNGVSREADHSELVFSQKEWEQLTELDVVLTPFKEYTDILQGNEVSTPGGVLPEKYPTMITHLIEKRPLLHIRPKL